jgi:hypothetical protein
VRLAGCSGMATWTSNSHTCVHRRFYRFRCLGCMGRLLDLTCATIQLLRRVRASSADPLGLYVREAVQFPVWTHESVVTRGPTGEWVAFMCAPLSPIPSARFAACRAIQPASQAS